MAALPNQAYANLDNPYWLKNPVPYLEISGTPSVTLTNNGGVLEVNGVPITGEAVSNWYEYPALNNIILFGDPLNPDVLQTAGGFLYFNGEILAQAGDISNVADWYLYPALGNVDMNGNGLENVSNVSNLTGCNLTVESDAGLTLIGNNFTVLSNYETNPVQGSSVLVQASGGTGGTLNLRADKGIATGGAVVNVEALAGDIAGYGWGGTVNIKAYSAPSAGATSKVTIEAAGVNSYAGAVPTVASLAGYNFIYGTAGVNICAGIPSIFPNVPLTTYIYGTAGVTIESGIAGDVQVKDSDFGCRKIVPYYSALAIPSNLVITGRSNALSANQYVVMSMVNNIGFDSQALITGLKTLTMSNGVICNVSNINLSNINGQPYAPATAWSTYPAVSSVNMSGCNISNVGTINGVTVQSPSVWASYPAIGNVDMNNFSISNVSNVNGVLYSPTCNWANFTAVSNVDVSSNQILFSGKRIREGAGFLNGASTSVEIYTPVTIGASTRTASVVFSKIVGGVPDYTGDILLYGFNTGSPARLQAQSTFGTETIAYLTDIDFRPSYDLYVAPNGSDLTGDGSVLNPYLTIGKALTVRAGISSAVEVSIQVASGTYTENITVDVNTYIVGVPTGEARQPVNVVGVITLNGTSGTIGLSGLEITGGIDITGSGATYTVFACNITAVTNQCLSQTAGTVFVTECRMTGDTTGSSVFTATGGSTTLRDCIITTSTGAYCMSASSSVTIRQCIVTSTSTSATAGSLLRCNGTSQNVEVTFTKMNYTSTTTDTGGNKCCIQFANSSGTITAQVANCVLDCVGASTGGTNIQAIQKTGAGTVNLTYGALECVVPAVFISTGIATTQMQNAKQGVYGCFSSSVTTTVTGANVPTLINHNIVEVGGGLSISGGNINLLRAGNYEVSTSIQLAKSSGGTDLVYFWFRLNGVDVPRSGSQIRMQNNNGEVLANVTAMITANAGDALSVVFGSADATVQALASGAQSSPMVVPAIPSCITSVKLLT